MKKLTVFKISIRLIVLVIILIAVYQARPAYLEKEPTIPDTLSEDDKISWTFYRYPESDLIYQKFTVYKDGRNIVELTRWFGSRDNEMLGSLFNWEIENDKVNSFTHYSRKDMISKEKASAIFTQAVESGVLDLKDEKSKKGASLVIQLTIGDIEKSVKGPDAVNSPIALPASKWYNLIFWAKLSKIVDKDKDLKPFMAKNKYRKVYK